MRSTGLYLIAMAMGLLGGACSSLLTTNGSAQGEDRASHAKGDEAAGVIRARRVEIVDRNGDIVATFGIGVEEDDYKSVELKIGQKMQGKGYAYDGVYITYVRQRVGRGEWTSSSNLGLVQHGISASSNLKPDGLTIHDDSYHDDEEHGKQRKLELRSNELKMWRSSAPMIYLGYSEDNWLEPILHNKLVMRDDSGERILLRAADWDIKNPELRFEALPGSDDKVFPDWKE